MCTLLYCTAQMLHYFSDFSILFFFAQYTLNVKNVWLIVVVDLEILKQDFQFGQAVS